MSIKISAAFRDTDSAEFARARLHSSGIELRSVRLNSGGTDSSEHDPRGLDVIINPYITGYSGAVDENMTSLAGANMQNYGGFLWSFGDAPLSTMPLGCTPSDGLAGLYSDLVYPAADAGEADGLKSRRTVRAANRRSDGHVGEVTLTVEVPEIQAGDAEGIIVSCHGSNIRRG